MIQSDSTHPKTYNLGARATVNEQTFRLSFSLSLFLFLAFPFLWGLVPSKVVTEAEHANAA